MSKTGFDSAELAVRAAYRVVPCICSAAHFELGLLAPDCRHHDLVDALEEIISCDCGKDVNRGPRPGSARWWAGMKVDPNRDGDAA